MIFLRVTLHVHELSAVLDSALPIVIAVHPLVCVDVFVSRFPGSNVCGAAAAQFTLLVPTLLVLKIVSVPLISLVCSGRSR